MSTPNSNTHRATRTDVMMVIELAFPSHSFTVQELVEACAARAEFMFCSMPGIRRLVTGLLSEMQERGELVVYKSSPRRYALFSNTPPTDERKITHAVVAAVVKSHLPKRSFTRGDVIDALYDVHPELLELSSPEMRTAVTIALGEMITRKELVVHTLSRSRRFALVAVPNESAPPVMPEATICSDIFVADGREQWYVMFGEHNTRIRWNSREEAEIFARRCALQDAEYPAFLADDAVMAHIFDAVRTEYARRATVALLFDESAREHVANALMMLDGDITRETTQSIKERLTKALAQLDHDAKGGSWYYIRFAGQDTWAGLSGFDVDGEPRMTCIASTATRYSFAAAQAELAKLRAAGWNTAFVEAVR